ncbi:MAG TPA: hypothetical protein PLX69_11135 [Leptospiraceae bacterium]|nr:hypothetical protein [Leptospiraceae bacterium]HRG75102.1 hypothetical protein [Leptospiraceae bacterium]
MKNFTLGNLTILSNASGSKITFSWTGASDNKELQKSLESYCMEILSELKDKEVTIDFTRLETMNSSSVPAIISWIKLLSENGITANIHYNKDSNWQKSSFRLLGAMSLQYKTVSVAAV